MATLIDNSSKETKTFDLGYEVIVNIKGVIINLSSIPIYCSNCRELVTFSNAMIQVYPGSVSIECEICGL